MILAQNYVGSTPTSVTQTKKIYMIIHKHEKSDSMSEYDYKDLEALDIDEIWYKYNCGSYEGSGQLIARKGDLFSHHDMGHCSCYGAVDKFEFNGRPLDELISYLQKNQEYYYNEIMEVLSFMKVYIRDLKINEILK